MQQATEQKEVKKMEATKKMAVLLAAMAMLLASALPAMATTGTSGGQQQDNGSFVLVLAGSSGPGSPVHQGQTYYVSQRGLDADPTVPICTTDRPNTVAQACHVDRNALPFAGIDGHELSYRIWMRDDRTSKVTTIKSGSTHIYEGVVIRARYGF
jgi:hypothetical protein